VSFTVDGSAADTTSNADNQYLVAGVAGRSRRVTVNVFAATSVKLKSTGTPRVSVTGLRPGEGLGCL